MAEKEKTNCPLPKGKWVFQYLPWLLIFRKVFPNYKPYVTEVSEDQIRHGHKSGLPGDLV